MASIRRRKNRFNSLVINGAHTSDLVGLKAGAVKYFKEIFEEEYPTRPYFEGLEFRKLCQQNSEMLISPFTSEEIDKAVASCDSQKSPGPDGFKFSFIKNSWEIIKSDIYAMISEFWKTGTLPKGCNTALVALIPKVELPTGFKDFRPISMIGCLYKILSKLLARRLQQVMGQIVGPYQASFIKGRQILDGALVAGEIIDTCRQNKAKALILKIDFHKAFDSVAWSFLEWVMNQMGFPGTWSRWMKSCVTSASSSIIVNGSPTAPFKLHRGLRQGDPLSPLLFDLVAEVLSLVIRKAESLNLLYGLPVCNGGIKISHLLYADDTIIFCPPDIDILMNIKKSLIAFYLASGLKVNFFKSSLMGINLDNSWLDDAAMALQCKRGTLPFDYLGLPIGGSSSRIAAWDPIILRMEKKLASWKGKTLSIGGRLALIKSSLCSLPLYFMSLFPIPKGVIQKINKIQRTFLWSGSNDSKFMPLMAWKKLELPKFLGGLGIGNLHHRNLSLLLKWIWRFFFEPKALWRQVVQCKYKYDDSLIIANLQPPNKGGPWRNICRTIFSHDTAKSFLKDKIRKAVGNGEHTKFWLECWIGSSPLKVCFPRLFSIASNQNASIASLGLWDGLTWTWSFTWTRHLRPRDLDERHILSLLLEQVVLSPYENDSLIWAPDKSGSFSVKSASKELAKSSCPSSHDVIKGVWRGLVPPRIELFLWFSMLDKINTIEKLLRCGIIPMADASCIFCKSQVESSDHLFIHCPLSWTLWG